MNENTIDKLDVYKVLILEDNLEASNTLQEFFKQYGNEHKIKFQVETYSTAKGFIDNYTKSDLVLIDIELPDGNGFNVTKNLREIDKEVMIIFVTNMAQYAVKGYEVEAFDFVVKPVNYYQLSIKMDRALVKLASIHQSREKTIYLKTTKEIIAIKEADIMYVEVINHSLIYHTARGNYEVYGTMSKASKELSSNHFEFCNRCYLVNLSYVRSVKGYECQVGNDKIAISHLKKKTFLEKLSNYFVFGN